jgi:transposase-like protein
MNLNGKFPLTICTGVAEICRKFGGPDQLRNAVNQLQSRLYASWRTPA